ncbi:MAG: polysaccharide biosynthesis C-terminal domain-containing protein [Oscillospiraceae bacterium]
MVIGGVIKLATNYTLVGNPKIMIFGAPVGTLLCFAVISILNLGIIKRMVPPAAPVYQGRSSSLLVASAIMAASRPGPATGCSPVFSAAAS